MNRVRRRGMSTLQAVLLLGGAFVVVWGLMSVWQDSQQPLQEQVEKTLRGEPGNPAAGNGGGGDSPPKVEDDTTGGLPPNGEEDTRSGWTKFLDRVQTTLDVIGLAPGAGEPADIINAIISVGRGNWTDAAASGFSALPFVGWGGAAAKWLKKVPAEELIDEADKARDLLALANKSKDAKKGEEALGRLAAVEKEKAERLAQGIDVPPTKLPRNISKKLYDELRAKTPTPAIRDMVNEGKKLPFPDPVLPGLTVTKRLHADHIVSMNSITRMPGFDRLSKEQMLAVLNNRANFVGLSEAANASKGSKSFAEWVRHKSRGIDVDEGFRVRMIQEEERLRRVIQEQINSYLK